MRHPIFKGEVNPVEYIVRFDTIMNSLKLHTSVDMKYVHTDLGWYDCFPESGVISMSMNIVNHACGEPDVVSSYHVHVPAEALLTDEGMEEFIDTTNARAAEQGEELRRRKAEHQAKVDQLETERRRTQYELLKAEFEPTKDQ